MKKILILALLLSVIMLSSCSLFKNSTTKTHNLDDISTTSKIDSNISTSTKTNDKTITNPVDHVNFVEINDTHGQLVFENGKMGLSEVGSTIKYLEEEDGLPYIKIVNGDLFQGTYVSRMTYGKCFIDALNILDFDFMVMGNHEFDWTLDKIAVYFDGDETNGEANFPILCCNLKDKNTESRPDWVKAYTIINYGDVKVGIIGAIGGTLESSISTDSLQDYYFDTPDEYIKEYAKELRGLGCNIVCLSIHDYDPEYERIRTFSADERIDAIFFGHTHQSLDGYYNREYDNYNIPYVQSYTKNGDIGTIRINLDNDKNPNNATICHYNLNYYYEFVNNTIPELDDMIRTNYQTIIDKGNKVLMHINVLDYDTKKEVADLAIDALLDLYESDVCILNMGGVRDTLHSEEVRTSDLFEIYPFDNNICILEMTGLNLNLYFNTLKDIYYNESFDLSTVDEDKVYKLVTINYVANKNNQSVKTYCINNEFTTLDDIMRDVFIEYVDNHYE
ncbi:bifunctional metallophosphatase/5'-nucleotidase [bacterium]|nr:bifunctional metallophosphatase/5'-nucleotidase [bacterium]